MAAPHRTIVAKRDRRSQAAALQPEHLALILEAYRKGLIADDDGTITMMLLGMHSSARGIDLRRAKWRHLELDMLSTLITPQQAAAAVAAGANLNLKAPLVWTRPR